MSINGNFTVSRSQVDIPNSSNAASGVNSNLQSGMQYVQAAYNVFEILDSKATEEEKIQAVRETVALTVADAYTGGLASQAYGLLNRYFPGVMNAIREFDSKYNLGLKLITGLFDSDKWKTEGNRLRSLLEKGVQIPEELQGAMQLTRGRSKEELIDPSVPIDFKGYTEDGRWINNAFAMSRDESLLAPEDIWGYAVFFEKFGNDWLGTFSEEKRRTIAERALALGLVREHHGTIDVTWAPELEELARTI